MVLQTVLSPFELELLKVIHACEYPSAARLRSSRITPVPRFIIDLLVTSMRDKVDEGLSGLIRLGCIRDATPEVLADRMDRPDGTWTVNIAHWPDGVLDLPDGRRLTLEWTEAKPINKAAGDGTIWSVRDAETQQDLMLIVYDSVRPGGVIYRLTQEGARLARWSIEHAADDSIEQSDKQKTVEAGQTASKASLRIDHKSRKVWLEGKQLNINAHSAFDTIAALEAADPDYIVYHADLLRAVKPKLAQDGLVMKQAAPETKEAIASIQRALRELGAPYHIENVRGMGYRLLHKSDT